MLRFLHPLLQQLLQAAPGSSVRIARQAEASAVDGVRIVLFVLRAALSQLRNIRAHLRNDRLSRPMKTQGS